MEEVQKLATKLLKYPVHHVIAGDYIFLKYDKKVIMHFVERMKPWNMIVLVTSNEFEVKSKKHVRFTKSLIKDIP